MFYLFLHPRSLSVPICLLQFVSTSLSFGSFSAWLEVYLTCPGGVSLPQAVTFLCHYPETTALSSVLQAALGLALPVNILMFFFPGHDQIDGGPAASKSFAGYNL